MEVAEVIAQLSLLKKKVHYRVGPFMQNLSIFLKGIFAVQFLKNYYEITKL